MTERAVKIPGPDHPISIDKSANSWRVTFKGTVIAQSSDALVMHETSYPPVIYFPRKDVKMELLKPTGHHTYCPYKGEAGYFTISAGGAQEDNAVWTYENPFAAVAEIDSHVAFYTTKVDSVEEV